MSLITKQIDELRAYAADRKGELARVITDAADTIELLSAKLSAANMERSSQYYHGGWIPLKEREPSEEGEYLVSFDDGFVATTGYYEGDFELWADAGEPLAWIPLPEPYREGR